MSTDREERREHLDPISLRGMGSLFFGGRVVFDDAGDSFHGDHGYAQFFVPEASRTLPIIMWHGLGQSGKTWESTPDGREGFWQIFTRRGWSTYLIDQPRRGRAGRAIIDHRETVPQIPNLESEAVTWETFRLGSWHPPQSPEFFDDLSFPTDPRSCDQFFRQQTPNTGPEPFPDAIHRDFMAAAVGDLVDQVGPTVLMTHSHSGQYGWQTALQKRDLVRAVVAIEVGEFAFPSDDPPADIATDSDVLREFMAGQLVSPEEFAALTRIPILLIYGDYIASDSHEDFGVELWRMVRLRANQFVEAINARGGDARLVELPRFGFRGNTHFPMTDLNNAQVADLISEFLADRSLADYADPHLGPPGRDDVKTKLPLTAAVSMP